jgi:SAM-dependent methyltransferase
MGILNSIASASLSKGPRGYSGARPDVIRMIAEPPRRVLDVGCGAGMTAALLASSYPGVEVFGVEPDETLANSAREHMSQVFCSRIDDAAMPGRLKELAPFDLIICADVLEHLAEPAEILAALAVLLSPGGSIVTSVPNVRHVSTFISLGLFGTWPARDRGIHDRTHLRFFARRDILKLGCAAGLHLRRERRNLRLIEASSWSMVPAKLLDFWPFRAFLTFQYLHLWQRKNEFTTV